MTAIWIVIMTADEDGIILRQSVLIALYLSSARLQLTHGHEATNCTLILHQQQSQSWIHHSNPQRLERRGARGIEEVKA